MRQFGPKSMKPHDLDMTETAYPVHPIAELFPLLEDEELATFAEDIRQRGLKETIKLSNGMIIDGRNRLKACELTGIEPRFEDLTFASEAEVTNYIVSSCNCSQRSSAS